jgi:phage terminase small subunit
MMYFEDEHGNKRKLTAKQMMFVAEYTSNGFNGTQAAIVAGYSESSSRTIASDLLAKQYMKNAVEAKLRGIALAQSLKAQDILDMAVTELQNSGDDSTQGSRKQLMEFISQYTGGFDANKRKIEHSGGVDLSGLSDEELKAKLDE